MFITLVSGKDEICVLLQSTFELNIEIETEMKIRSCKCTRLACMFVSKYDMKLSVLCIPVFHSVPTDTPCFL